MAKRQADTYPDPPPHLSGRSADLWRRLGPEHADTAGRQEILLLALTALDRSAAAREAVEREGMTTVTATTKAVHLHPLLRVEREAHATFLKAWQSLGLGRRKEPQNRRPYSVG